MSYLDTTAQAFGVMKQCKRISMIKPTEGLPGVRINVAKIKDVQKLLEKLYGNTWGEIKNLKWYRNIINGQNNNLAGIPEAQENYIDGRIIGGEDAAIIDFPYQLSLGYFGSHSCGASIISADWLLTAAHCGDSGGPMVAEGKLYGVVSWGPEKCAEPRQPGVYTKTSVFRDWILVSSGVFDTKSRTVRVGTSQRGSGGMVHQVITAITHPDYNYTTLNYDIALLQVGESFENSDNVRSVDLPEQDEVVPAGTLAVVTGWGQNASDGYDSNVLQEVEVPVVSEEECQQDYLGEDAITPIMICAGYHEGGKDACQGDSGGPLAASGTLIGIVSSGEGCAEPNKPGVYTRVSSPFVFSDKIQPIRLPTQDEELIEGTMGTVTGWGVTKYGDKVASHFLLQLSLPVMNEQQCNVHYKVFGGVTPRMFCAGYSQGGGDVCQGESGGPLMADGELVGIVSWGVDCGKPEYPGVYTRGDSGGPLAAGGKLVGIVSWGDQCALPDRPGVYTRVSYYRDWIKEKTGV
uniref:Peptidase S1 domain-containing protein n=1 Tax=Timema cristinae TaxID=61476 RepID=A0A7R9CAQ1_TIMCR|nr:unnamed protein product [Timema cristinae]